MINHQAAHAAVDGNIFAVDERVALVAQESYYAGDVCRFAHTAGGMLGGVALAVVGSVGAVAVIGTGVYPAGCYRVDARHARQTDGQRVSQCRNAAFGCRIALGVGLRLEGTGRRNVHDGPHAAEVVFEELGQQVRSGHAHALNVEEVVVVAAFQNASVHQASVVDEAMDALRLIVEYQAGEVFQCLPVGYVAYKASHFITQLVHSFYLLEGHFAVDVDEVRLVTLCCKMFYNATADAAGSARYDNDSVHGWLMYVMSFLKSFPLVSL